MVVTCHVFPHPVWVTVCPLGLRCLCATFPTYWRRGALTPQSSKHLTERNGSKHDPQIHIWCEQDAVVTHRPHRAHDNSLHRSRRNADAKLLSIAKPLVLYLIRCKAPWIVCGTAVVIGAIGQQHFHLRKAQSVWLARGAVQVPMVC